jgi:hypothetical protein
MMRPSDQLFARTSADSSRVKKSKRALGTFTRGKNGIPGMVSHCAPRPGCAGAEQKRHKKHPRHSRVQRMLDLSTPAVPGLVVFRIA